MSIIPRHRVFIAIFLFVFILSASALSAQEKKSGLTLSLMLNGGVGFLLDGGGDLEQYRQQITDYHLALSRLPHHTGQTDWAEKSTLPALDGELVFQFGRSFGIGIGSGLISVRSKGTYGYTYAYTQPLGTDTYILDQKVNDSEDYKLTAIPLKVSFYGYLPLGRLNAYARAGLGYYFGRLTNAMTEDASVSEQLLSTINPDVRGDFTVRMEGTEEAKVNALGFHGGLGLEYRTGVVAFGLECFGRWAQFSGWSGSLNELIEARFRVWKEGSGWQPDQLVNATVSENGKLYYAEYLDSDLNSYYGRMRISKDKPFGLDIRNSREASINLNTIGLVFSVRFIFN
jgi:hypothetical protein